MPTARWQSMTNGGLRNVGTNFRPPSSIDGTSTGVVILAIASPRFHTTPSASSRARHSSPVCFIAGDGGHDQLLGMLRDALPRLLRLWRDDRRFLRDFFFLLGFLCLRLDSLASLLLPLRRRASDSVGASVPRTNTAARAMRRRRASRY